MGGAVAITPNASIRNKLSRYSKASPLPCSFHPGKRVGRGAFQIVAGPGRGIYEHIEAHNGNPAPFIWTAGASGILEKVKRGRAKLNNLQSA